MENKKLKGSTFTEIFVLGCVLAGIVGVVWGLKSTLQSPPDNSKITAILDEASKKTTNEKEKESSPSTTSNPDYSLTKNPRGDIDIKLNSKTPFEINFPTSLSNPITISLPDNQNIQIIQKNTNVFTLLPEDEILETQENSKLLSIIKKDPILTSYKSQNNEIAFYTYQKSQEQKQTLFKNWILYNSPQKEPTNQIDYEIKNALVNIDSSGDAQVSFDDKSDNTKNTNNTNKSDFTIPKPYFLDKDGQRTDLNWQFDKTTKLLSVSFTATQEQYPIALDPSIEKTDTVIATFSGKRLTLHAPICGVDTISCGESCSYEGQIYNTILIGSQCWFKENLNVGTMLAAGTTMPADPAPTANDPSTVSKWCYSNLTANCIAQGGLYTWAEANGLASTCNTTTCTPTASGICPTGWHVPTHDEYTTMERAICTSATCATDFPYNTTTTGYRGTDEGSKMSLLTLNGNNSSGFTALLAGYRSTVGSFNYQSAVAGLWTASEYSATDGWRRTLFSGAATVLRGNYTKTTGFSVRCVED